MDDAETGNIHQEPLIIGGRACGKTFNILRNKVNELYDLGRITPSEAAALLGQLDQAELCEDTTNIVRAEDLELTLGLDFKMPSIERRPRHNIQNKYEQKFGKKRNR